MAFNVINLKHRDVEEAWLHIKDADGELMYADEKKKKPVRIKFKSIHSDAFRKAFFKMNIHLANLKNGKKKEYEKLASEQAEVSREQVISDITEAFLGAEDLAIDMVTELAVDWEGFVSVTKTKGENGEEEVLEPLEFNPDHIRFVVSQPENYHVLKQIRDSFNDAEVFMEA